jgi:4-hydroxy-tetrahydrodipicolinate synthase
VADLVGYISKHHQIIGVKDATNDIRDVLYMGEGFGKKAALLQGLDDGFIPTLASGGSGGLMAFVCPVPEVFVEMYRAWGKGDMGTAVEKQMSIVPAMKAVGREPMPVLVKEAMNVVGRPMGPVRPPLYEAEAGNKRAIWAEVEKLVKG